MLDYTFHITTPRLYLSHYDPTNEAHLNFTLDSMKGLQEVANKMQRTVPIPTTIEEVQKNLQANYDRQVKTGYGRYLISLRPAPSSDTQTANNNEEEETLPFEELIKTCTPVGHVSMQFLRFPNGPKIPDVGFQLHCAHQRKGYATEAAEGLMRYYETERGIKGFCAMCDEKNEASKGVMKKMGFENRGERDIMGVFGADVVLKALVWTKGVGEGDLEQWGL